jgi:3-(3-hydroxy-phenyl)propionate hydroxylase
MDVECDVIVAGLGPVGAAVAALLSQKGHSVIALDREMQLYPLPRAVGFDGDIMRIFQRMGLADEVGKHIRFSPYYDFVSADGKLLLSYDRSNGGHPSGWLQNVTFYQPAIEQALRAEILSSGRGDIFLGYTFESLAQDEDGVSVTFRTGENTLKLRGRYMIGCDGARSEVRAALGIGLEDLDFNEPWLVVDFLSDDLAGLPDRNIQVCDPKRPATYMQMGPGRYRWEFMIHPGEDRVAVRQESFIRQLLSERGLTRSDPIERSAVYQFHGLIAETWRKGRVLLAGDAAHQMPPFAGQGFCSGLRDAFNLAWKLDLVLSGQSSEELLDSYEAERKPQVAFMIETAIRLGRIVCTTDPDKARERDAAMLAQREAGAAAPPPLMYPPLAEGLFFKGNPGAGELFPQPCRDQGEGVARFDDLVQGRAALVARHSSLAADLTAEDDIWVSSLDRPELAPFRDQIAVWLQERSADAVLIRPDFYVFGTGKPDALITGYRDAVTAGSTLAGHRSAPRQAVL